jgi:hypothetical protein
MKKKNIDELFIEEDINRIQQDLEENKADKAYKFYFPYYHKFKIVVNKIKNYLTLEKAI